MEKARQVKSYQLDSDEIEMVITALQSAGIDHVKFMQLVINDPEQVILHSDKQMKLNQLWKRLFDEWKGAQ